jgi:DtxR family Mn-dependent transcriptional regulator
MNSHLLTESSEMYLKALAELGGDEPVPIARLAERLGITQVSTNERIKRLAEQGLVSHIQFKGVALTNAGRLVANNVIRRQRLWEHFLYSHLLIPWENIYEYACDLEHATAPEVTEALAAFLNHPQHCPHGDSIPSPHGEVEPLSGVALSTLRPGQSGRVLAVRATSTEIYSYLAQHHLMPEQAIKVLEIAPLQGPIMVTVNGVEVAIGLLLAELILIQLDPN